LLNIAVIPGDGTGAEVVAEGLKVLEAVARKNRIEYSLKHFDYGGERYLRTGEVLPEGAVEELRQFDAIYLGAVGHPDVAPGILEKGILLELRFRLDQYMLLRHSATQEKAADQVEGAVMKVVKKLHRAARHSLWSGRLRVHDIRRARGHGDPPHQAPRLPEAGRAALDVALEDDGDVTQSGSGGAAPPLRSYQCRVNDYFSPSTLPPARRRIASSIRLSFVSLRLADSIHA